MDYIESISNILYSIGLCADTIHTKIIELHTTLDEAKFLLDISNDIVDFKQIPKLNPDIYVIEVNGKELGHLVICRKDGLVSVGIAACGDIMTTAFYSYEDKDFEKLKNETLIIFRQLFPTIGPLPI